MHVHNFVMIPLSFNIGLSDQSILTFIERKNIILLMIEAVEIDSASVHNLGLFAGKRDEQLQRSATEVLVIANDQEYQRLVRALLSIPQEQIAIIADAMTELDDYAYTLHMPNGEHRDSLYVHGAFLVVTRALQSPPESAPHE